MGWSKSFLCLLWCFCADHQSFPTLRDLCRIFTERLRQPLQGKPGILLSQTRFYGSGVSFAFSQRCPGLIFGLKLHGVTNAADTFPCCPRFILTKPLEVDALMSTFRSGSFSLSMYFCNALFTWLLGADKRFRGKALRHQLIMCNETLSSPLEWLISPPQVALVKTTNSECTLNTLSVQLFIRPPSLSGMTFYSLL